MIKEKKMGNISQLFNFASINISLYQFHNLFFVILFVNFSVNYYYWIFDFFFLLPILLKWPIQFNQVIQTNKGISNFPNICINSWLYCFLQSLFSFTPTNIYHNFFFKVSSCLTISLCNVQDSALYVATGLSIVL